MIKRLAIVAGFLMVVLLIPSLGQSVMKTESVRVTNTVEESVPVGVQGTVDVNVQNTPAVSAQQSGPWTVQISGTPTVRDATPLEPFQRSITGAILEGALSAAGAFQVPAGRLLVIQSFTGLVVLPEDQQPDEVHLHVSAGGSVFHTFAPQFVRRVGVRDRFVFAGDVTAYATGEVEMIVSRGRDTAGIATFSGQVSGYLV